VEAEGQGVGGTGHGSECGLMPVGRHNYLALPQPRPRDSDAMLYLAADEVEGARFWARDGSEAGARRELARAVKAWQEEKLERDWAGEGGERWRA
jgi:hypothetical protein